MYSSEKNVLSLACAVKKSQYASQSLLFATERNFRIDSDPPIPQRAPDISILSLTTWLQADSTTPEPIGLPLDKYKSFFIYAGLLLFGKNPNRFLPQAGIDAVAYPDREKDYTAKERFTIRGAMVPLAGYQDLVENGLVEQAMEFIKRNTGVKVQLIDGVRRENRWDYPEEALREAIINALVHRDYLLSGSDIELSIYEDRLEVGSPGRLPYGITPERMLTGCRTARNQLLKDVMRDYGYLEHMGMGIPRKIVKGMQAHNGTMPELIIEDERFVIRLLNPQ